MIARVSRVRRDLQGLRAIAVLAVVGTHLTGWPRGGFVGVDVFFVLSGFLVTGILLSELRVAGTIRLATFFARRLKRLLPAALLVMAVVVAAGFALFSAVRAERTVGDALAAVGLVSNWRFGLEGRDYFATGDVSPLQHFWSLSVEEQFSVAWPVVVLGAAMLLPRTFRRGRGGRMTVAVLALAVIALSGAAAVLLTPVDASMAYFSTTTRVGELAVGAVLAASRGPLRRLHPAVGGAMAWVGLGVVVAAFFVVDPAEFFPAPWAALPVAGAALVIAGGVAGDPRHRHLYPLSNPVAVAVGDVSYSLYLWHLPVIVFAGVVLPPGPAALAITALGIAVLTVATYLGVEQPLHRLPWPLATRQDGRPVALPPAPPTPSAAPAAAVPARASVLASRPPGWVPGQRYYPGSRPTAPAAAGPASAAAGRASAPAGYAAATSPTLAAPATVPDTRRPGTAPAHPSSETPAPDTSAPAITAATPAAPATPTATATEDWATWRERFAPRAAMGLTSLVLGAGATVLAVLLAYGAPALPGMPTAAPASTEAAVDADDALATLQAQIAAATTADAWPTLHPSLDQALRDSSSANPAHDCFTPDRTPDADSCSWGDPGAAHHLYLVGDSSAMAYAPAFARLAAESGGAWRVTTVGMYGCRFTDVLIESRDPAVTAGCDARKREVSALVSAAPADLVVVSNAFTLARSVDGRDLGAGDLASATARLVSAWAPPGRTVYLAPPPHGADLGRCFSPVTGPSACLSAVDDVWTQMQTAAEAQAATTGDAAISALPFTCWQGICPAFAGNTPVRYDDTHVTPAFAERLTPILRAALADRGLY